MNGPELWPALIVGARGDIGTAIADRFEAAGHHTVRTGRAEFDLTAPEQIDAFFKGCRVPFRIIVYCAAINRPKPFDETSIDEIELSLQANLVGFLRVLKHAAPTLADGGGGRIVGISSIYGFLARAGRLPYVMSKHALLGAMRVLAIEYGCRGVLSNALSPGYVDTTLTRQNNDTATIDRFRRGIPVGRLADPTDIADVAYFLASPQNRYINGQDIVVDGGFTCGGFQL